jgi:chemotaxis receptor (MCP) glutamine deamidase CheD
MRTTLEAKFTLWIDDTGECIVVGDDRDGLDMTEILFIDETKQVRAEIRLTDNQVPMLVEALERFGKFKRERQASLSGGASE